MVTMTVYANVAAFCWIVNCINGSITCNWGDLKVVSLKKTRKFAYEIQVPIVIVGQFVQKDRTTVDLFELQQLQQKKIVN